jgi:hypothetical protein
MRAGERTQFAGLFIEETLHWGGGAGQEDLAGDGLRKILGIKLDLTVGPADSGANEYYQGRIGRNNRLNEIVILIRVCRQQIDIVTCSYLPCLKKYFQILY